MLSCVIRITGFRAGINRIRNLWLCRQVIAGLIIYLKPLRILDDHIHFRVDALSGLHHDLFRNIFHLFKPEFLPALRSLLFNTFPASAVIKIEIIKDQLIKNFGIQRHCLTQCFHIFFTGIAQGIVSVILISRTSRNSARGSNSFTLKISLHLKELLLCCPLHSTEAFNISPSKLYILIKKREPPVEFFQILYLIHISNRTVHRHIKILVAHLLLPFD